MTFKPSIPYTVHSATISVVVYWFIALVVVGTRLWQSLDSLPWLPAISNVSFGCFLLVVVGLIITMSPQMRVGRILGLFCLAAMMSLLLGGVTFEHRGYERLCFFVLMLCLLSPLVSSAALTEIRRRAWRLMMLGLRAIVVVSFVMYIPWEIENGGNHYCFDGLVGKGILLGIITAIVFIDTAWHMLRNHGISRYSWMGYGLLLAMSVIVLVASGSRSAMLSVVAGLMPILWSVRHQRLKLVWTLLIFLLIIVGFSASSFRSFEGMQKKNHTAMEHGTITYSRNHLWSARLQEFAESPVIGIGFGLTSERPLPQGYDPDTEEWGMNSTIEPGSSWLNVLGSMGMVGFALLLVFNIRLFGHLRKSHRADGRNVLLMALLVALWVHGCFEGWVLYAGGTIFMIYWLLTSQISDLQADSAS